LGTGDFKILNLPDRFYSMVTVYSRGKGYLKSTSTVWLVARFQWRDDNLLSGDWNFQYSRTIRLGIIF